MKPVEFDGANVRIGKGQPQYFELPAKVWPDDSRGRTMTRWKLSIWEKLYLLFGGQVGHEQLTFGQPFQPMTLYVVTRRGFAVPVRCSA